MIIKLLRKTNKGYKKYIELSYKKYIDLKEKYRPFLDKIIEKK